MTFEEVLGAAHSGDIMAQLAIGDFFWERNDYHSAVIWFTNSAKQGNIIAQFNLGVYYRTIAKDDGSSFYWHKKAAEQGEKDAQNIIGEYYLHGIGVECDYVQAVHWFKQSAKQGDAIAMYRLGQCYAKGLGVHENKVSAIDWLKKSEAHGYRDAEAWWRKLRMTLLNLPDKMQARPFNEYL